MSYTDKIPCVMRRALTQYIDIRDELEDFNTFLQDICCEIGGTIDEIDDQLDLLTDRLISYNEALEKQTFLTGHYPLKVSATEADADEELPFPDTTEAV